MPAPLIAHIHVPKTAGTAFRSMLENRFGPDHANLYVDDTFFFYPESEIEAFVAARPGLRSLSSHFMRTYPPRIAGREVLYVTFLRKPVEQFLSYLTYTKKYHAKIPDQGLLNCLPERASELSLREIARWILSHPGVPFHENCLVNYFAQRQYATLGGDAGDGQYAAARLALAKSVLADFFLTGVTERMDESVRRFQVLGERYGIQVPYGEVQVENVSREVRDDLKWIHPDDEVGSMLLASVAEDQKLYDWALARFEQDPLARVVPASPAVAVVPKPFSFATQVYWHFDGDAFSEQQSIQRSWAVGPATRRYRMRLPPFDEAPAQLRLDITDRPAVLKLHSVSLVNEQAEPLWSLDFRNANGLMAAGMRIVPDESGDSALVTIENSDGAVVLPLDSTVLNSLKPGAILEIEMNTVEPVPSTTAKASRQRFERLQRFVARLSLPIRRRLDGHL